MNILGRAIYTTIGEDLSVEVNYDYEPATPMRMDEPPSPAEAIITSVCVCDNDMWRDIMDDLSPACLERLEEQCVEAEE